MDVSVNERSRNPRLCWREDSAAVPETRKAAGGRAKARVVQHGKMERTDGHPLSQQVYT